MREKCEIKCNLSKLTGISKSSALKDIGWPVKVTKTGILNMGFYSSDGKMCSLLVTAEACQKMEAEQRLHLFDSGLGNVKATG